MTEPKANILSRRGKDFGVFPLSSLRLRKVRALDDALVSCGGIGPGFHMVRHLLSFLILAHHCRVAVFGVGVGDTYEKGISFASAGVAKLTKGQIIIELLRPGLFALVGMFFALSGFLVVASAIRSRSTKTFFANRALRIVPALSVEVALSALVLGPLVTSLPMEQYFSNPQFWRYFGNIIGEVTFELPGVFLTNPWPALVNANLWTLPPEFGCYLLMLILMVTGALFQPKRLTAAIGIAAVVAVVLEFYDPITFSIRRDTTRFTEWYVELMFLFGALLYVNAARIPLTFELFLAAAVGYYLMTIFNKFGVLSGMLLAYCAVYIGMQSFPLFDRFVKKDLSYGIYLYGFPITQATILLLLSRLPGDSSLFKFLIIFPVVLGLTVLFATVSWNYIEKPALAIRKYFG